MMERRAPALSIVTPVYNMERYIRETIGSVLSDMSPDDRYVVVDDGSSDGTVDILREFGSTITLLSQQNGGEIAAVNAGVALTSTDIVGIVNADDPILPGLLNAVRKAFLDDPDLAAVYPDWVKIDGDGARIANVTTVEYNYSVLLAEHMCIPGPGAFFKKSVLREEPIRDPLAPGISDYDFWLRYGRHGARVQRIPKTLATWRLNEKGTTLTYSGAQIAMTRIKIVERLLELPDLPDEVKRLAPRARSAAYYNAALVGVRGKGVPALRYAMKSYAFAMRWPRTVLSHQRRSLPHIIYAAAQPLSGLLHRTVDPLLPRRFRRAAVLSMSYGRHVDADR